MVGSRGDNATVRKADLTEAWIVAESTVPPEWRLMGVVRGPRDANPRITSDSWVAWMRSPEGIQVEGTGETPDQALLALADTMRETGQEFGDDHEDPMDIGL
jgi:hypothetical protein